MPIYEYACSACGHQFEEWQKITDKPVRTCPKCKAKVRVGEPPAPPEPRPPENGFDPDQFFAQTEATPRPNAGGRVFEPDGPPVAERAVLEPHVDVIPRQPRRDRAASTTSRGRAGTRGPSPSRWRRSNRSSQTKNRRDLDRR